MNLPPRELDSFYRFFRISGMEHCSGGAGAWQIGQSAEGAAGVSRDAQENVLARMVEWVERGEEYAPETLTGRKFVNVCFSFLFGVFIAFLIFLFRFPFSRLSFPLLDCLLACLRRGGMQGVG